MVLSKSLIAIQAVAQLKKLSLFDETGQQAVAQLVRKACSNNINLFCGLTLMPLKANLLVNIPAEPMEFDLSNFMLKLCGFSFFSALLTPLVTINLPSVLNNNQWRFV